MKKILKICLIAVIMCMIMGNVYATSCNMELQYAKTEFEKEEEFSVDLYVSNIQSNRGFISLSATLEYDKDNLTLLKMEGQNGWETPTEGASYNSANGKIAITRNGLGKNNEVILKITFKVKDKAIKNPNISFKDVAIADGDGTAKFDTVVSGKKQTSTDTNNTNSIINNLNNTTKNQTTTIDNTTIASQGLPKTGNDTALLVLIGLIATIIAVYCAVKVKLIKNKENR